MEWQDIGRILKQQREKKGYNREDVYKATKISIMNIEALEQGNFDALPHPVYTKAFIKAYAEFLELDPSEFIEAYERTIDNALKKTEIKPIIKSSSIGKGIWIIVGFILFILITILFFYLINRNNSSNHKVPSVLKESEIEKMTGNTVKREIVSNNTNKKKDELLKNLNNTSANISINLQEQTNPRVSKNATLNGSEKKEIKIQSTEAKESLSNSSIKKENSQIKEHVLKVVANAPCWLKGEYDKNGTKEAYLLKGQKVIFKFTKSLKVKFGNLGGVDIFFDGKKIQINGRKGEVKTIVFPLSNN